MPPRPSLACSLRFSSSESTSKETLTPTTPSSLDTASVTADSKVERIGHPGVVSETFTSITPLAWISIERTISSVTMSLRSSGSMTALRASRTWSRVGMPSIVFAAVNAPTPEEAAAVIAALEQFLRDTAPPGTDPEPVSGWLRAARIEAVDRDPGFG